MTSQNREIIQFLNSAKYVNLYADISRLIGSDPSNVRQTSFHITGTLCGNCQSEDLYLHYYFLNSKGDISIKGAMVVCHECGGKHTFIRESHLRQFLSNLDFSGSEGCKHSFAKVDGFPSICSICGKWES